MSNKPIPISLTLLLSIALYLAPASLRAAEQTSEHRVVGLFAPDRVDDFHKAMDDIPEIHLIHLDYETARATFGYDVQALFPERKLSKPPADAEIEQRLSNRIAEASNTSFTLKPCSKVPREKLAKVEINVGILHCRGCRFAIHLMLMNVEGVEQATVVGTLVTAWIDPARTNQTAVEAALKRMHVPVLEKK